MNAPFFACNWIWRYVKMISTTITAIINVYTKETVQTIVNPLIHVLDEDACNIYEVPNDEHIDESGQEAVYENKAFS